MQWSGKIPNTGLTSALRERKELEQANRLVVDALAGDPAFRVYTVDGTQWICPYSGALVACAPGSLVEAQQHLFQSRPWTTRRGGKSRPLFQVLEQKWTLHLTTSDDPRFRRFDDTGKWRNPFTGVDELLPRARSAVDPCAIVEIARALAGCAEAQAGAALR